MNGTQAALTGILVFTSAIWLGGLTTIAVVARIADRTLEPRQRIEFFRGLGRAHGLIGTIALLVAFAAGAALLRDRPWGGLLTATATVAACLLGCAAAGMAQARRMTRLRLASRQHPDESGRAAQVRRGARNAALLRIAIGLCSLALVALGAVLSS
jgi:hypothetical protein